MSPESVTETLGISKTIAMQNMRKIELKDGSVLIGVRAELVSIGEARSFGNEGKVVHTCAIKWTNAQGVTKQSNAFAYGKTVEQITEGQILVATPVVIDGQNRMKLTHWSWNDSSEGIASDEFGELGALLAQTTAEERVA